MEIHKLKLLHRVASYYVSCILELKNKKKEILTFAIHSSFVKWNLQDVHGLFFECLCNSHLEVYIMVYPLRVPSLVAIWKISLGSGCIACSIFYWLSSPGLLYFKIWISFEKKKKKKKRWILFGTQPHEKK